MHGNDIYCPDMTDGQVAGQSDRKWVFSPPANGAIVLREERPT